MTIFLNVGGWRKLGGYLTLMAACTGATAQQMEGAAALDGGYSPPSSCATEPARTSSMCLPRYPWDSRFNKCFMQDADPTYPGCVADDWPNFTDTRRRLTHLIERGEFSLLERALAEVTTLDKRFPSGDLKFSAADAAIHGSIPSAGIVDKKIIARWKAAMPESPYVIYAEALDLYTLAWKARGEGFASTVSPASWKLFSLRLQQAQQKLLSAPQAFRSNPMWHFLMLEIALDSPKLQSSANALFETAVEQWPRGFIFYELLVMRMVPRWGGSWEEVDAFINLWSKRLEPTEGTSMYARLYLSVNTRDVAPGDTKMNWPQMSRSFADLTARYPHKKFKNMYASYACIAKDKDTFNKAMIQISKDELMPENWRQGYSYEACMRWAGI